jgi:hypothetical protein
MNNGDRVTQKNLFDVMTRIEGKIDRLEDKTDKRLCKVEDRSDDLDRRLANMEGKASVAGGIAGSIAGLVGNLVLELIKRGV